ncbi:hepatic lectin [Danio aesculapii]|uniref:hepatic lectin n=1 Tax=Danio aesculapii TaxID=1142201 RepID=UPI0024BF4974|nr:hepatic lectin [Danio aesculapii]
MAEDIYENMNDTESAGMNRKRVVKMEDLYVNAGSVGNHDYRTRSNTQQPLQNTGSDPVKTRSSRAALVCLLLLCFLLLTAVIGLSVYIYTNKSNCPEGRRQLLTKIANLTGNRDELMTNIENLLKDRDQLIKQHQIIAGWTYFQSSFYYLSNESKSWFESRRDCRDRKADLITINNQQEQDFVMTLTRNEEFWIGLTDSEKEGSWKWVDGSTLTTWFWASFGSITEPNGGTRENCVLTPLKRHPELIGWIDHSCDAAYQWICEKSILPVTF